MSEISVVVVGSTSINSVVGNGDTVNVNVGDQTVGGGNGAAATIQAGTVTTIDATQTATVTNVGTAYAAKFNFSLPRGATGSNGPANSLSIGSVSTGATAAVSISGTAPSQSLSFVLQPGPTGSTGPANSLSIGSVTTGATAAVSISGSAPSQSLSFVLQPGPTGSAGPANSLSIGSVTTGATAAVSISGSAPSQTISFVLQPGPQGATGQQGPAGPPINLGDETPQPLGAASAGTALAAARADHVHAVPSIAYSSLTGVPSTFAPSAHSHAVSDVTGLQTALDGKQAAGNYATLVGGTVPSAQLPSFVDDIVEYANLAAFAATGEVGKIFVARDTGKIYRWSGSAYIEISPSPGSTDSVTEGSVNLYHTTVRAAAAAPVQSVSGRTGAISLTKSDVGLDNVPNTDATARSNHTGTQTASTISDFATEAAKYGPVTSVSGRTGVITLAQLGSSGTASASTFLRGDGQWTAAGGTNIVESATAAGFPATGASQTLYISTDANRVFRFDASGVYVEVGPGAGAAVGGGAGGTTDPLWSSVRLLLPLDANTYDYRSGQGSTVTAFGSAAIASSSPKFGSGCLFLDGNSDYLQVVDGFNYIVPGTGDFTIEAWVRPAFLSAEANYVFEAREIQVAGYGLYLNSSSTRVVGSSATSLITGAALSTGQWHHVALCRASGTLRLFINGTVAGTPVANTTNFASNRLLIGRSLSDSTPFWFDGNIDDVRYTSAARYTSNFSVATAAFPTS